MEVFRPSLCGIINFVREVSTFRETFVPNFVDNLCISTFVKLIEKKLSRQVNVSDIKNVNRR